MNADESKLWKNSKPMIVLSVKDWKEVIRALAWINSEDTLIPNAPRLRKKVQQQAGLTDKEVFLQKS